MVTTFYRGQACFSPAEPGGKNFSAANFRCRLGSSGWPGQSLVSFIMVPRRVWRHGRIQHCPRCTTLHGLLHPAGGDSYSAGADTIFIVVAALGAPGGSFCNSAPGSMRRSQPRQTMYSSMSAFLSKKPIQEGHPTTRNVIGHSRHHRTILPGLQRIQSPPMNGVFGRTAGSRSFPRDEGHPRIVAARPPGRRSDSTAAVPGKGPPSNSRFGFRPPAIRCFARTSPFLLAHSGALA